MKRTLLLFAAVLVALTLSAQTINRLDVELRGDWQYENLDGNSILGNSGFDGKFFNFRMDGSLLENLSYSIRYRAQKVQADPFAATDWATLTYSTDKWDFSAGKQVVAIGGYEYDRAPIDIYFASEYWHQIACYQFGASATFKGGENTRITAQICRSPYDYMRENLYAYNLMWTDKWDDCLTILHSFNVLEYAPNKFVEYVALGHLFELGRVAIEFDYMERIDHECLDGINASTMLDLKWKMSEKFHFFAHGSYDVNKSTSVADLTVMPGTEMWRMGGGVEYFPFGNKNVRFHVATAYAFGKQTNLLGGGLLDEHLMVQFGLTWRINLF